MAIINRPDFLRNTNLNELLRWAKHTTDNVGLVNLPQTMNCSLYFDAAYSVPNSVNYALPFDSVAFANGGMEMSDGLQEASALTTSDGIFCPVAGLVQANYSVQVAASAGGTFRSSYLQVARTATDNIAGRVLAAPAAATDFTGSGSWLVEVAAGDVIGVVVRQDSGGALALTTANRRCQLSAFYVSVS